MEYLKFSFQSEVGPWEFAVSKYEILLLISCQFFFTDLAFQTMCRMPCTNVIKFIHLIIFLNLTQPIYITPNTICKPVYGVETFLRGMWIYKIPPKFRRLLKLIPKLHVRKYVFEMSGIWCIKLCILNFEYLHRYRFYKQRCKLSAHFCTLYFYFSLLCFYWWLHFWFNCLIYIYIYMNIYIYE